MKYYAGIGSRRTPTDILDLMATIAAKMAGLDRTLRSGGAIGADMAFERGCDSVGGPKEIFYAKDAANDSIAHDIASQYHQAWHYLTPYVKNLMARNVYQILGRYLKTPVRSVICWTPDSADGTIIPTSKETGGTGQAIRVAAANNIPVYNLFNENIREVVKQKLGITRAVR